MRDGLISADYWAGSVDVQRTKGEAPLLLDVLFEMKTVLDKVSYIVNM